MNLPEGAAARESNDLVGGICDRWQPGDLTPVVAGDFNDSYSGLPPINKPKSA